LVSAAGPRPQDDPTFVPDAVLVRPMSVGDLRAVSMDLLGRPPFANELEPWVGKSRDAYVEHLLGNESFWRHWWAEQLYYFMLIDTFRPRTDDVNEVPIKMSEGRLTVRDALHRIALTPTFELRNPGADTFVTVVMEQYCGMVVQDTARELKIGKNAYDGKDTRFLGRPASNQADVVRNCVEHKTASRHFTAREYERLTGIPAEKKALIGWSSDLHKRPHSYTKIFAEWIRSSDYDERLARRRPKSNRLFVRALYVDLLDRLPTEDETESMRNALDGLGDPRPLRALFARLILDSSKAPVPKKEDIPDPTLWVGAQYRRLLGREASQDELRAFVTAFHEPACRPETLLYAILSHAEYQTY
jgi:hypothetical protein